MLDKIFKRTKQKSSDPSGKLDKPKEVNRILEEQLEASLHEFNRSNSGLLISAFGAGLEVGFSVLLMGTVFTLFGESVNPESLKMYLALSYPLGFIFVIIGRSELFTEHTALALLPVLNKSVQVSDLFKLWGLVYTGNIIGGFVFSFLLTAIGPLVGFISKEAFYHLAYELIDYEWYTILTSALLAGWMMGLLGWLLTSSQETISRIVVIVLITTIIGIAGLHHCIVGSIEVFAGFITSRQITLFNYLKFQIWATIGNAIGGAVFVAILKFSHVRV
ncbi:MAG: formate/nitrite transporter family protein [Bacteroidota bacterium]